jgi:hypothetical protein
MQFFHRDSVICSLLVKTGFIVQIPTYPAYKHENCHQIYTSFGVLKPLQYFN